MLAVQLCRLVASGSDLRILLSIPVMSTYIGLFYCSQFMSFYGQNLIYPWTSSLWYFSLNPFMSVCFFSPCKADKSISSFRGVWFILGFFFPQILYLLQTVWTLIRRYNTLRCLIWVDAVCCRPLLWNTRNKWFNPLIGNVKFPLASVMTVNWFSHFIWHWYFKSAGKWILNWNT